LSLESVPTLDSLRNDADTIVYAFSGYDGRIILSKPLELPWHSIKVHESWLQVLPRFMRGFSGDYGRVRRRLLLPIVVNRIGRKKVP